MAALDKTMGALLMGVIISGILYGLSCSQVYYYFSRYGNDRWSLKALVLAVWIGDSLHQALITHAIYWYLVTEWGNPEAPGLLTKTIVIEIIVNGVIGVLVQSFFVMRVWRLSKRKLWLAIPVGVMVAVEFGAQMAYGIITLGYSSFADVARIRNLSICINVFAAVPDIAIAIILCTILHKSRTQWSRTNTLINKLIVFSVNTGLLTSIDACISLITFFALPNTLVYICFYFMIGRLYSNSLMATLNARKGLRHAGSSNVESSSLSLRDMTGSSRPSRHPVESITIRIDTKKETHHDRDPLDDDLSTPFDNADKRSIEEV